MKEFKLSEVRVAVHAPQLGTRRTVRDMLLAVGLNNLREYERLEHLKMVFADLDPDLLFLPLEDRCETVCDFVRDIRNGRTGRNPYAVVVALTWNPEGAVIGEAIDAGVDDIVTLPFSVHVMQERIENLIENRKEFVITATYVGPDRRRGKREKSDDPGTVRVPNSLRYKATGDAAAAARPEAIAETERLLQRHRIHRIAARISHLGSDMKEHAVVHPDRPVPMHIADEIESLLDRIAQDIQSGGHAPLMELMRSMREIVAEAVRATRPDMRLFEILELHGQAIRAALDDADGAAGFVLQALEDAASIIRARAEEV